MIKWSPVLFHRLLQLFFEPFLSGPEQFLFDNNQQGHPRKILCVIVCNDCVLFVYSTWSWKPLPPPALFMGDSFKFTCEMWRLCQKFSNINLPPKLYFTFLIGDPLRLIPRSLFRGDSLPPLHLPDSNSRLTLSSDLLGPSLSSFLLLLLLFLSTSSSPLLLSPSTPLLPWCCWPSKLSLLNTLGRLVESILSSFFHSRFLSTSFQNLFSIAYYSPGCPRCQLIR